MFMRLTAVGSDGTDTAVPATRADLIAGKSAAQAQDVEVVLDRFAAERLLTLDADAVEISHEALLTAWPLLRDTGSPTPAPTVLSAPGCRPPPRNGPMTPATRPTCTAAACWRAPPHTAARIAADPPPPAPRPG